MATIIVEKPQHNRYKVVVGPCKPKELLETIQVLNKRTNDVSIINLKDLGTKQFPALHFRELTDDEIDIRAFAPEETKFRPSAYSQEDMASMPIKELEKIPEASQVSKEARKACKNKAEYIDVLLEVRREDFE